jgi:hypothetical protein
MQEIQQSKKQSHYRSENLEAENKVFVKSQTGIQWVEPSAWILLIFVASEIRRQRCSKKCGSLLQKF